jgi:16S rRNA processing protein RimM
MTRAGRPLQSAAGTLTGADDGVELGRIVAPHGIRGEVRVLLYNPESATVVELSTLTLLRADGTREQRRVLSGRPHKQFALLQLDGVVTANDAEALIGCRVVVPRAALPAAGPRAVYHVDLIGCTVRTTGGEPLGTVRELIVTGSNDVCVVRDTHREFLIPFVADVIAEVDTTARTIVVHPVPGLLDP